MLDSGKNKRFWEIDFLRGIAIIMMIVYHIFFDIYFFNLYDFNIHSIGFEIFLYLIGTTFLLLVGISLTLSYNREKRNLSKNQIIKNFGLRSLKIFSLGLIITVVTFFYLGDSFIVFGVLHCIGLSIILSIPLLKCRFVNLFLGFVFIFIGIILRNFTFDFNYLLFIGFKPYNFSTVDYFPIFPWFGVILIGIFLGNVLYKDYKRSFKLSDLSEIKIVNFLGFLGRNSLIIYFLHQPIIISIIYLLNILV